ncbi:MAG: efflux RND transporter periplasmic adaptor subunit [Xanthomonadaceae bacterium]|nr:efflux RND transporter periplasmic adaptor subunit [Xanthomonadaceae bacterium]
MKRFSSFRILGLIAAFLLIGVGSAVGFWRQQDAVRAVTAQPAAIPVAVAVVEQRDVPHLVNAIGYVRPIHSVTLHTQVDGILTEVLFEEGQQVAKGDLLARIDDRAIQAALKQAQAELARVEAELEAARLDLERYAQLVRQNAVSRQEYDRQKALVAQLEAMRAASEATVAAIEVELSYTRIVSPVSGRIGFRRVDAGNYVRASDSEGLFSITQIKPIEVVFSLSQSLLPQLRAISSPAPVRVYDRVGGILLGEGQLTTIDNQVDRATGTIRLKATLPNRDGMLWPGQAVVVQLQTGTTQGALVVPAVAVRHGLEGRYVFRITRDYQAEPVPVQVAFEDDEMAVIDAGLAAGDVVVIDGHARLRAGSRVTPIAATGAEA